MKHGKRVRSASFSPDSQQVVSASEDGTVRVWIASTGQPTAEIKHESVSVTFSPDGRRVLGISKTGAMYSWEIATGRKVAEAVIQRRFIRTPASYSQDTRRIIAEGEIWDATTGHLLAKLQYFPRSVSALSPDGRQFATGSKIDEAIVIQDTHWLALYGEELIAAICREKLNGAKILTANDIEVAPILKGREGEDVCASLK